MLSSQGVVKQLRYVVVHARELGLSCDLIRLLLLLINVAAQAELATQDDGLGNKAALFPAPIGAAANLVAFIAD